MFYHCSKAMLVRQHQITYACPLIWHCSCLQLTCLRDVKDRKLGPPPDKAAHVCWPAFDLFSKLPTAAILPAWPPKHQRLPLYFCTLTRTMPICRRARQVQRAEAQWAAPFITPTAWQRGCAAPFAGTQARIQIWCTAAAQESYSQSLLNQLTRSEQCSCESCSCLHCTTQRCFSFMLVQTQSCCLGNQHHCKKSTVPDYRTSLQSTVIVAPYLLMTQFRWCEDGVWFCRVCKARLGMAWCWLCS